MQPISEQYIFFSQHSSKPNVMRSCYWSLRHNCMKSVENLLEISYVVCLIIDFLSFEKSILGHCPFLVAKAGLVVLHDVEHVACCKAKFQGLNNSCAGLPNDCLQFHQSCSQVNRGTFFYHAGDKKVILLCYKLYLASHPKGQTLKVCTPMAAKRY